MAGDVLSQSEIDALLSALSTGEMSADDILQAEDRRKVKNYDFKRALRFSKDHIRSLTRVHENFSRLLTTYLSSQLRTHVHITVASVDQIPFEEFIRSIPNMTLINVFAVPPLDGNILVEVNPNIVYSMLDRLMGGSGTNQSKTGTLTEIETKLAARLFERGFDNLREAWTNIAAINPKLTEVEVNPQFLQMISPNETVIVISLKTVIGTTSGVMNICIPHVVLEPIVPNLSVRYWMQANKKEVPKEEVLDLQKRVKHVRLPVTVELGSTFISIEDFLHLQAGDVIRLDKTIAEPLNVKIGSVPKFTAQPGQLKNKLAVQLLETAKGGEEDE